MCVCVCVCMRYPSICSVCLLMRSGLLACLSVCRFGCLPVCRCIWIWCSCSVFRCVFLCAAILLFVGLIVCLLVIVLCIYPFLHLPVRSSVHAFLVGRFACFPPLVSLSRALSLSLSPSPFPSLLGSRAVCPSTFVSLLVCLFDGLFAHLSVCFAFGLPFLFDLVCVSFVGLGDRSCCLTRSCCLF